LSNSLGRAALTLALICVTASTLVAAPIEIGNQFGKSARLRVDVRDHTGAIVPRARVTVIAGGIEIENIPDLMFEPGTYTVRVTAPGFRTQVVQGVSLSAGLETTLRIRLTAGGFSDQAIVTAAMPRGGAGATGRTFDGDAMRAQPSAERDPLSFVKQAAGVSPPAPGSRLSTQGNTAINSSGAREAANNFLIDGADNNDLFLDRLIVNPSLDAVAEVDVQQNTYDAEFGRSAGARINMVLKSGTSDFSGSGYEFFRRSPRHLFGGTFGGPMSRSGRSFFCVSAEGVSASEEDPRQAHVPTQAERAGDFSASGITIVDPFTGAPFPGNVIPADRISAASRSAAALYPAANRADAAINFGTAPAAERAAASVTAKADHRWRGSDLLSMTYSFSTDRRDFPFVARNRNLPGFGVADLDRGHSIGLVYTRILSARAQNVFRAGLTRSRRENLPGQHGVDGFAALGIAGPRLAGDDLAFPTILVAGFETLGDDANLPVVRRTRGLQVADTLTLERGPHQIKAGVEWRSFGSDGDNRLFSRGRMSFSGAFTGNGFADLLLGFPSFSLLGINDNRQALRAWSVDGFLQDEWRVTSRLTASAGLRYEFNAPPTDAGNRMRIFDQERLSLVPVGENGVPASGIANDLNNFAPRLGISWDLTGRGRTVARGGYGIFYDSGTLIENSALYFNPPFYSLQLFFPSQSSLIRIENPFPAGHGVTPITTVNSMDQHFRTAYSHQVSASIEHGFGSFTGTARYVGTFGRNLVGKRNINQPVPGPGAIDPRRPLAGFGDILMVESRARSAYHSLQLSLDRRLTAGVEAHAAYTLSRSMDDASAFLASDGNDNTPQDSRNLAAEWGLSDFDVRHRFVASVTWNGGADEPRWWLRHWRVAALFAAQSGRPFTPRLSTDNSNTGNTGGATFASDRPDVLTGSAAPGQETFTYGDRTFVLPARYSFGNAGRNILTGPGYASLDMSVGRVVNAGSRRTLEFRVEIFNVLNRYNGQLPDSFVDHATFGKSLGAFPRRQLQIAVRLNF
jgi:hypothetical protein